MKKFLFAAATMFALVSVSAFATDLGVSITIGQPGFYGHIDIGNAPQPQVIYPQPVIIQPVPAGKPPRPIYLRVPPGHEKNWKKHCREYNACGQQVYFVRDKWYNDVYVPHYKKEHGNKGGEGHGEGHGNGRGGGQGKGH